jgi:hypothetical protein
MTDIHSCSYYCDRPECIKAQRDELRDKLAQPEQTEVQRLIALVRAQQITIDKLEAQQEQEPSEKFCDSNCVWTDHHPDCKLAQPEQYIGERGMEAYEAAKERGWVGLSDERLMEMPKQEPVAWIDAEKRTFEWNGPVLWNTPTVAVLDKIPLYTTPPAAQPAPVQEPVIDKSAAIRIATALGWEPHKRTWVRLTDEEVESCWRQVQANDFHDCVQPFARDIEAKLKAKNFA